MHWLSFEGGGTGGGFSYQRTRSDGVGTACDVCGGAFDPDQAVSDERCAAAVLPYLVDPACGDACQL